MYKQPNIKLAIILPSIIIASILAAPFVYAAVEPHIIIQMVASQTTNPFEIQDSAGDDQFTINELGSIEREGGSTYLLRATSEDITFVNATHVFGTTPLVLDYVKFTPKTQNSGDTGFIYRDVKFQSEMIQDIGTGSIQILAEYSEDDVSWATFGFCTQTNPTWVTSCTINNSGWTNGDPDIYFRISAINSDGATSGAIAHYDLQMELMVPPGWVVDPTWTG